MKKALIVGVGAFFFATAVAGAFWPFAGFNDTEVYSLPSTEIVFAGKASIVEATDVVAKSVAIVRPVHQETKTETPQETVGATPVPVVEQKIVQYSTTDAIFFDSFAGWWSIEQRPKLATTTKDVVHAGMQALEIEFAGGWDELHFANQGIDMSEKEGIRFAVAGAQGGESIYLTMYDPAGNRIGSARLEDYTRERTISKDYSVSYITMRALGVEGKVVSRIVLSSEKPAHIYLDTITFSGPPADQYAAPMYVSHPEIYINSFRSAWSMAHWDASVEVVNEGADDTAVQVLFTDAFGALQLKNAVGMNTYTYHHLNMNVKGWAMEKDTISIVAYEAGTGNWLGRTQLKYHLKDWNYGNYQKISIPLSQLGAEDKIVGTIRIESSTELPANVYFDDIAFSF